jgi:hypothetical protein
VHQELLPTLTWLRELQRRDGGWGQRAVTLEETAYAVLALRALRRVVTFHGAARD